MSNKTYYSYIRVSTQRQGQLGTSLVEQQAAIENYARKFNLRIVKHFEERETAAKAGRPVFMDMIKALRRGEASGVIIHKIDRSSRNLKDWAELQSLTDAGVELHFAAESLNLSSRGGRLAADIQAVVASDYIRNLRDETIKGMYGRLKQGIFPFPAPVGYLDAGKGKPKKIDPAQAPFIRQIFELYATGNWGFIGLTEEMYRRGLRNKSGGKVTINGIATILHSSFYIGIIKIEKTGETFMGKHPPLISKALYNQAQNILEGKNIKKTLRHFFVFRKHVFCSNCKKLFIAEKKKGWVYYRCHTRGCTRGTIKEELLEKAVVEGMEKLRLSDMEYNYFKRKIEVMNESVDQEFEAQQRHLQLLIDQTEERLSKLGDAYVDNVFDKKTYIEKKNAILLEEQSLRERQSNLQQTIHQMGENLSKFLELLNRAYLSYKWGTPEEKRELVKTIFSNCEIKEKNVIVKAFLPFQMMMERPLFTSGSPERDATRTLSSVFSQLYQLFSENDTTKLGLHLQTHLSSTLDRKAAAVESRGPGRSSARNIGLKGAADSRGH